MVTEGTSNRSEKSMDQMRPVSACTAADLGQLLGRGATGLVDHHILARTHRLDGQRGPIPRDGGDDDKCDIGAVEQVRR
jgi:hypothetical protein